MRHSGIVTHFGPEIKPQDDDTEMIQPRLKTVATMASPLIVTGAFAIAIVFVAVTVQARPRAGDSTERAAAQHARDTGDAPTLEKLIQSSVAEAAKSPSAEAQLRVALYNHWLVEVGGDLNDKSLEKTAAFAGRTAAETAVSATPDSPDAHALLGLLLGDCIPHTSMGGMRFGPLAQKEFDKALELQPLDADAYIGEGIGKLMTPTSFGGSAAKAVELFGKSVEIDPSSDTPHVWLALAHQKLGEREQALQEVNRALALNPGRRWSQIVKAQVEKMR